MRRSPSIYNKISAWLIAVCCCISACQKEPPGIDTQGEALLKVRFLPVVEGQALEFGKIYTNAFGEPYSVSAFKFYLHGIVFTNTQTNTNYNVDKNGHYLINTGDPDGADLELNIASSSYDQISFIIGVDSIRNNSGAQTGALDPARGMFWTWSTGYIMAKLEGNSPVAATPNNAIEYHIGGFKAGESVLRKVVLDLPPGGAINLKQGARSTITITANVNSWFNQQHPIRISQNPVSMTPGSLATRIADNYSYMFTIAEVINE